MNDTPTSPAAALAALKEQLPPAPPPIANYSAITIRHGFVYTSGHPSMRPDGTLITGQVGTDIDNAAGYAAARCAGLALLATLAAHFETLDDIERILKLTVMINATPEFTEHATIADGCSDVLAQVFADRTPPSRSAFGVSSLPRGIAIEAELIATTR